MFLVKQRRISPKNVSVTCWRRKAERNTGMASGTAIKMNWHFHLKGFKVVRLHCGAFEGRQSRERLVLRRDFLFHNVTSDFNIKHGSSLMPRGDKSTTYVYFIFNISLHKEYNSSDLEKNICINTSSYFLFNLI